MYYTPTVKTLEPNSSVLGLARLDTISENLISSPAIYVQVYVKSDITAVDEHYAVEIRIGNLFLLARFTV